MTGAKMQFKLIILYKIIILLITAMRATYI